MTTAVFPKNTFASHFFFYSDKVHKLTSGYEIFLQNSEGQVNSSFIIYIWCLLIEQHQTSFNAY